MFFTYRKFFDAQPAEPMSAAATMAKSGRIVQPDSEPLQGNTNTEQPKTETAPASETVVTTTQTLPAEQGKTEVLKPSEGAGAAAPAKEEPAKAPTWQEVLKQQQPDTVFKELGYDDKVVKFITGRKTLDEKVLNLLAHYESGGDLKPYFEALTTDYSKMPAEEVMRRQLQRDNPELTADQLNRLYAIKVTNRYKLDPAMFSEQEVTDGQIELLADAKPVRNALAKDQENYLMPKAPERSSVDPLAQIQQQEADNVKKYIEVVSADPYFKEVVTNQKITIGKGDDAFSYPIPKDALNVLFDQKLWASKLFNEDGSPNPRKQILLAAIVNDDVAFLDQLEQHFRSKGGNAAIAPIVNAKLPDGSTEAKAEKTETNPAKAMAKHGRIVQGNI